jgi:ubiquinone/menaquinone biosynthesis C-methylase UbiE
VRDKLEEIANAFDARAATYGRNAWHRQCAEQLVALCRLRPGHQVLDAGTGTGFAALAAARVVGPDGRVLGVDLSAGMLREAKAAASAAGLPNVAFAQSDVSRMTHLPSATFDAITCAAGLLYMPVAEALQEWRRLLKPRGIVAFSSMRAGSPPAARLFRDCAARFGLTLPDPSVPLGTEAACRDTLEAAGFAVLDIVGDIVEFTAQDFTLAWESNYRSAGHAPVQSLDAEDQARLKQAYLEALAREQREDAGALARAGILYAVGTAP